jgi:hypothetical protein
MSEMKIMSRGISRDQVVARWKHPMLYGLLIVVGSGSIASEVFGQADASSSLQNVGDGDAASDLLARRVASLKAQIQTTDAQIALLERRLAGIEKTIDDLVEQADAIEMPEPEPEEEEDRKKQPREVAFRPPILRTMKLETPLALICEEGRVYTLDFDRSNKAIKTCMDNEASLMQFINAKGGTFDAGDYDRVLTLTIRGNDVAISDRYARKSGSNLGEPHQDAVGSSSRLRKRLAELNAAKSAIQFAVYPDSFDMFRDVRQIVWDGKFNVNWNPMVHGEKLSVGASEGGIAVQ